MKIRIKYSVGKWFMRGYRGRVFYPFMFFLDPQDKVPNWLFRHELEHIYQVRRLGWWRFNAKYLYYLARRGYQDNPFEIEARKVEKHKLTAEEMKLKNG
jgi:hypothetical protein